MSGKSEEKETFLRKFDLVKKMYFSDKVIAANKKDLIFNWFLEQFGCYNDKKSSYVYELLWNTFHEIVQTEKQNSSHHRILIKSNVVINLLNAVANYPFSNSWASVILASVSTFLQTPTVNATLIADIDILYHLLIATVKVISKVYESNRNDVKSLNEAKNLCSVILNILENLSASNEEEKILLLSRSLQDLALFMHLAECDKQFSHLSKKLAQKIVSIVFNLKSKQYETLLTPVDISYAVERPNTYILQFFLSLRNMLMKEDILIPSITVNSACGALMKRLLKSFLSHNRSSLHSLKIMSLIFAVAGLDIPITLTSKSCCNSLFKEQISNAEVLIVGLSYVLEACSGSNSQYFTTMNVPEGYLKPSMWLKGVAAALLDARIRKNKSLWLNCFNSLVWISPTIIEDALPLIKTVLLSVNVNTLESRKQYCKVFSSVLRAHTKLNQIPKFFVKLLLALTHCIQENSGGDFLTKGQLFPEVEESIAKSVQQLPYGQMIELWKSFNETFSSLETMSERLNANKGFIFYVAQIFSTFLLHAQLFRPNVPSKVSSQYNDLIENTGEEIKKNLSILKETDSKFVPVQKSILHLCYALGEVKLAYYGYYGKFLPINEDVRSKEDMNDFSVLLSFLDKEYVRPMEKFLESGDKILFTLVLRLWAQKVKSLQFRTSNFPQYKIAMHAMIGIAFKRLEATGTAPWDMDISSITDKNYGTVMWTLFFKVYPVVLNLLSSKEVFRFCRLAQSIVLQDDSSESGAAKSLILAGLKSEFLQESQMFQTAFVSVIWKQENILHSKKRSHDDMEAGQSPIDKLFVLLSAEHSKALKYAKRTPKDEKDLGSIWKEVGEASDILNDILLSQSLPKRKLKMNKIYDFIMLLNTLPLDYLLPANQMKCVIGLSLLFFLIPRSCESVEAVPIAKEITSLLTRIFGGVRSIWLFDFVISGPYMRCVMQTIQSIISVECNDDDWAERLIDDLFNRAVRNVQSVNALELLVSELAKENKCTKTTLMVQLSMLGILSLVLPRRHNQQDYQESLNRITSLALEGFIKLMKLNFKADIDDINHVYFIKCYIHVIEIILFCNSNEVAMVSTKCLEPLPAVVSLLSLNKVTSLNNDAVLSTYLLLVSKICRYAQKLKGLISKDFIFASWKFLLSYFEEKKRKKKESFTVVRSLESELTESSSASSNNLCAICSCYSSEKLHLTTDENSPSTNNYNNKVLSPLTLSKFEEESLKELSLITDDKDLEEVFQDIVKELSSFAKDPRDVFSLQMSLLKFQCLIDANDKKTYLPLMNGPMQTFMTHLFYIANQTCSSAVCQTMVLIPVLDFMSFVIKGYKCLPRHMLLQSLHCVTPLSLEVHNNNYELFVKSFNAACQLVYNLFTHHPDFIVPSRAPFLSYVSKLLKSIVKAGDADALSKCNADTFQQVKLCANDMDRLLTVTVRKYKTEFSKLVPYLVADYVDVVQHITLNSGIKESLLSGIHRLLDICSEESIKMQSANISYVCREIYGNLVKNYKQNKKKSTS